MEVRSAALWTIAAGAVMIAAACGGDDSLFTPAGAQPAGAGGSNGGSDAAVGGAGHGGSTAQGGASNTGGGAGVGGSAPTGGTAGSPGTGGAGGSVAGAGGVPGTGGVAGAGGAPGTGGTPGGCAVDPASAPSQGSCVSMGAPGYPCNPITNAGCNGLAGEACDFNGTTFKCFPSPNNTQPCGVCNTQSGPFCIGGFTCFNGTSRCTRYCCSNSDCAAGTWCVMQPPTSLGICQAVNGSQLSAFKPGSGGSGGSGQGGSGGGSGGAAGACAHSPCVMGGPLDVNCDPCIALVCGMTATCCSTTWDTMCVQVAMLTCGCTP